jgi:predicted DNA-binding WGR domain protein
MPDLRDGESIQVKGSARDPYVIKNVGGVYSCTCPAWRNQSVSIQRRTCKHIRSLRGEQAEQERLGSLPPAAPKTAREAQDNAPQLLLANSWDNATDLTGWWMSEKLDGVRAWWDGKQFLSRLGNVYHAPDWFIAGLPAVALDGELWLDRKAFQRTVSIVRRQDKSDHWRQDPPPIGSTITYRYQELTERGVPRFPSFVRMRADVPQPKAVTPNASRSKTVQAKPKPSGSAMKRYFEFIEGNSSKFWEIAQSDKTVTVRFGRIGTNGQTQTKEFADADAATKHVEKLIKEKTGKGYKETAPS